MISLMTLDTQIPDIKFVPVIGEFVFFNIQSEMILPELEILGHCVSNQKCLHPVRAYTDCRSFQINISKG